MMMKFEIDTNRTGQYTWRLRARNRFIIATAGESYVDKSDAEHGIRLVKKTRSITEYSVYQDNQHQWQWQLVAANGQVVAVSSESYVHRPDCEDAVHLALATTSTTPVIDLTTTTTARMVR
jgi:uncharacterized protein